MDENENNPLFLDDYDPYVFKRKETEYDIHLSPVSEYLKQASTYLSKTLNCTVDEARVKARQALKTFKINNPEVSFREKQENGDMVMASSKLTDYIKSVLESGDVIVPSFTTYMHPSKKKSLHADFLTININARKSDKKMSHKYEQDAEAENATDAEKAAAKAKALYYEVMQKTRKVANNSLSGAYASKSSILNNPSAHYTLTSMTRCVASIGNMITEALVGGNKLFKTPDIVLNYISAIVANMKRSDVDYAIHKFKLHIPTTDEILKSILFSTDRYWKDEIAEQDIRAYIDTLDDSEKAVVLYTNDMWHLKEYNDDLLRVMIKRMIQKVPKGSVNHLADLYHAPEGVTTLTHFIFMDEIRGKDVKYEKLADTPLLDGLASTTRNISTWLKFYKPLIKAFFMTDILPVDIAYIKEMLRDNIVLSDTDSTCGAYDRWVEWYFGEDNYETEGSCVASVVMLFNTQAMDHNIKQFARNMNIDPSRVELLKMKNEFYWPVFITANKNKHYYAMTAVKEGNVYAKPKLERKGVHLIASAIDQKLVKISEEMMVEIPAMIMRKEKIDVLKYVKVVADIERELMEKVKEGDISIFKLEKIKNKDSYKNDEEASPYMHHIIWQKVFADKYGSPGEPMYMVIKIPLTISSKKDMENYLLTIKDESIKTNWINCLNEYDKDTIGTFRPPVTIVSTKGIPEEIKSVIDTKRIVFDNCTVFYNVLETIGFYRKPKHMICEMGY